SNRILPLKTIAWTIENPPAPFFKGDSFLAILRYKNTQKSLTECHCPTRERGRQNYPELLDNLIPVPPFRIGEGARWRGFRMGTGEHVRIPFEEQLAWPDLH
ncbi:MAG: hypothetical protein QNJ97_21385, partial [Myxococcota bacterium]|nr:hypothetical protein [Myxococcota bacterium]